MSTTRFTPLRRLHAVRADAPDCTGSCSQVHGPCDCPARSRAVRTPVNSPPMPPVWTPEQARQKLAEFEAQQPSDDAFGPVLRLVQRFAFALGVAVCLALWLALAAALVQAARA